MKPSYLLIAAILTAAPAAIAQTDTRVAGDGTSTTVAPDADIAKVRDVLVGSWKSTTPSGDLHMHIAAVPGEEMPDTLYVELCLAETPQKAYRQSFMQLYRFKGKLRMRTLEFRRSDGNQALGGLYAAPDLISGVAPENLVATQDMEFAPGLAAAQTPYPYPTNRNGAVEMTSRIELAKDKLVTADRGFDASGAVVWGAATSDAYTWTRFTPDARVTRMDKGLVVIDFNNPEGDKAKDGDTLAIHYSGWLKDGTQFDSSIPRGMTFDVTLPAQVIEGFSSGIAGLSKGAIRRIFIPAALGYGERGGGPIPPNSDLVFEVEIMDLRHPKPEGEQGPQPVVPPTDDDAGGR